VVDIQGFANVTTAHFVATCRTVNSSRERRHYGDVASLTFQNGGNGKVLFDNRITGNFTVYQDRLNNSLQLFADTENSERFFIISVVIFEVNIVAKQKKDNS